MNIFGQPLPHTAYTPRLAVYAVIFDETRRQLLTVKTTRGDYFLPGGGIEENESHAACLKRELLEETGARFTIGSFIGEATAYFLSTQQEPIQNVASFYVATLRQRVQQPTDDDHTVIWLPLTKLDLLVHAHQRWAVAQALQLD